MGESRRDLDPRKPVRLRLSFRQPRGRASSCAARRRGVEVVDALVKGVEKDRDGNIAALVLDDGRTLAADFFIDCTGFRRQLIQKELGAKWISYGEELPVNRALPFWLDHKPGAPIAPYTLAWAQSSGWIWFIPTQDRFGCGYVYSDAFLTPDQAKAEVEKTLGPRSRCVPTSACRSGGWKRRG